MSKLCDKLHNILRPLSFKFVLESHAIDSVSPMVNLQVGFSRIGFSQLDNSLPSNTAARPLSDTVYL